MALPGEDRTVFRSVVAYCDYVVKNGACEFIDIVAGMGGNVHTIFLHHLYSSGVQAMCLNACTSHEDLILSQVS